MGIAGIDHIYTPVRYCNVWLPRTRHATLPCRTQTLPKLVESLDAECRERSSTVRLVGCGTRHTVAVLGNGDLFIWGRPDFGRLGRSKNDSANEPLLVDALWRRDVAEGGADRTKALGKVN